MGANPAPWRGNGATKFLIEDASKKSGAEGI